MKSLLGIAYALGGMVIGFAVAAVLASLGASLFQVSSREGAAGYLVVGVGLIGALGGLAAGLLMHARSAPEGQMLGQLAHGVAGVVGLCALAAVAGWAWLQTREVPVTYNGNTMANLRLEFRLAADAAGTEPARRWLNVEVTTTHTRPEALVLEDAVRREGGHLVVPAVQGPLIRAGNRLVVARIRRGASSQDEVFRPPMPRRPDPQAGWSEWMAPQQVFATASGDSPAMPPALLQMRWRIELYGQ